MSQASGTKRTAAPGTFTGSPSAPVFGPSIPSSVYPKDSVRDVAEALGIVNLRDNIATALATDIEYRIRDIAQSAAKYMKHAKRSRLTTADVDNALRQKNIEPLYGFFPPYTAGKARGPWFRAVPTSGAPLYMAEDEELDFDTILETGPRVGVGRGVGWHAHWLAIEGIQPPVPENPVFLARQSAADGALPETPETSELNSTAVKPLVKHVLSRELQLYYERLTSSIISPPTDAETRSEAPPSDVATTHLAQYAQGSSGNSVRDAALASLRGDAGIHQLVPYLIQWVGANVTHMLRTRPTEEDRAARSSTIQLLHTMLDTLHALLVNPAIFIEPYLHQLMPSVLSILLAVYTLSQDVDAELEKAALALRLYAATLLAHTIDHFAESYPTLKPRVVATLVQALFAHIDDGTAETTPEASGSLDAKVGALIALRKLGPASFKTLLGSVGILPPLESSQEHNAERIPLHDMGTWLDALASAEGRAGFLTKCIRQHVCSGLHALGLAMDGAPTALTDAERKLVEEAYGAYWLQALGDDIAGLAALVQYRPLAQEEPMNESV